jgi:hypothetical protein
MEAKLQLMSTDKTIAEIGYDLDLNIQPTSLDFSKNLLI